MSRELDRPTAPFGSRPPTARPSGSGRPSRPRGGTVSLPETRDDLRRRTRPFHRAGAALAIVAGAVAAAAAGWTWREVSERGAIVAGPATAIPTATLTPPATTPTPTTAALVPHEAAAPPDPGLVGSAPQPAAAAIRGEARPARAKTRRGASRAEQGADRALKDPYADDESLKDPFR
jgi:hypothetical protein